MKFINIMDIDNTNILSDFLNTKKLLEKDLKLDKEMSYDDFIKNLQLEKQVLVFKKNNSICFSKKNINNEDVLFFTLDKKLSEEDNNKIMELLSNFNIKKYNKQNIFNPDNNLLEREYYFIINNDFYY